jgi:hypothetical protein
VRALQKRGFSVAEHEKSEHHIFDLSDAIIWASEKSASVFAKGLAIEHHTLKMVLRRDLRSRKFTRKWVPHEGMISQKSGIKARELSKILREDADDNFARRISADESRFFFRCESSAIFARNRSDVVSRVSRAIRGKKRWWQAFLPARAWCRWTASLEVKSLTLCNSWGH